MFTGIIADIGKVAEIKEQGKDRFFKIRTGFDTKKIDLGASISCSGCCLTVIDKGNDWFSVDVSGETLSRTKLGKWAVGTEINLEKSLKAGDEMGGHMVSGHVDGLAEVKSLKEIDNCYRFEFIAKAALMELIAEKGSITLDGVSLTVNDVTDHSFTVNIIPHTYKNTTFRNLKEGDEVNLEIDVIARYTARLLGINND